MISKKYDFRRNFLFKFGVMFVATLLFDRVIGSTYENVGILEYFEELGSDILSENKNTHGHQHARETQYDSKDYPYAEIRKIVKETKEELAKSKRDRNILKFNPKYDDAYISKYNERYFYTVKNDVGQVLRYSVDYRSSPTSFSYQGNSKSGKRKNSNFKMCGFTVDTFRPERLPNENGIRHLILNLEGEFVQEVTVTKCLKHGIGTECGSNVIVPELYKNVCEQSYVVHKLFAIPEGEEIDISTQVMANFKLPNGCICKTRLERK